MDPHLIQDRTYSHIIDFVPCPTVQKFKILEKKWGIKITFTTSSQVTYKGG